MNDRFNPHGEKHWSSIEYTYIDKEFLQQLMEYTEKYSTVVDVMKSDVSPHTKLTMIWDIMQGKVNNER